MENSRLAAWLGLPRSLPVLVLVIGLIASLAAGLQVQRVAEAKDRERFNNAVAQAHAAVAARLQTYTAALRGGTGLFAARPGGAVTREEFRAYAERLDLPQVYPGIQGLGFSAKLPGLAGPETAAMLARHGVPGLEIHPSHPRPEVHAILFLEPLDRRNRAALGYDMYSNAVRRAAMAAARDTGRGAMSGKVELVQEIDRDKQAGFLIYHPVYRDGGVPETVAQRRAQLIGFVYAPFRADDLLRGIFGDQPNPRVRMFVYDETVAPENLLHASTGRAPDPARFTASRDLEIGGRRWRIVYAAAPGLEEGSTRGLAFVFFVGGMLATGLVAFATWRQVRARLTAEDEIAARREAEHERELLVAELNHRVKNTLATVQSIAAQSLREGRSAAETRETFEARLLALSHTHNLLTRAHWRGADLREIVRQELSPHGEGRVRIDGGPVSLPPAASLAVGMALHELATNAAKYGALSRPEGQVAVAWQVIGRAEARRVRLTWREIGGPPVAEAPRRRGFGTRLITQGLKQQLEGEVEMDFRSSGLVCVLEFPLRAPAEAA
ncbi:sensor histidine kinase [Phenylobacterium zucineum HLK1]|uniref:histidine kinase n=1 Tax=Phenylobacterium zucineum (strain HLK1) TaxID=450851 RepID=B4RFD4_PHEZH|nr:sensor histidine kinase [Phenylobacterium zucineum HLK1]